MTARLYRHDCGMEVLCLNCDDPENLCAIGFLTVPHDSTGVQHIIEHCICEGSEHYPVKSPFSELERSSMATLLNAFTYNDHTIYPFASAHPLDFKNIFDVYWDCVFHPTLKRETFLQEGWHLGFLRPGFSRTRLVENGIVLNEMKAAMSELDSIMEDAALKTLLPGHSLSYNSGGAPDCITTLTYEAFRRYHAEHYSPSAARILLYGNLKDDEKLALVESHMESLPDDCKAVADARMSAETSWTQPQSRTVSFAPASDTPPGADAAWSRTWLAAAHATLQEKLTAELVDSILFDNEGALLRKIILESGLADDLYSGSGFDTDTPELIFSIGAVGLDEKNIPKLQERIDAAMNDFALHGPTAEQLQTAFRQLKVEKLEIDNSFLYDLIDDVFDEWLRGNSPIKALDSLSTLQELERSLTPQTVASFVKKRLIDNPHRCDITFHPDRDLPSKRARAEQERLKQLKASLSPQQLQEVRRQQCHLIKAQTTADTLQALATLPKVKLGQISPQPLHIHSVRLTSRQQVPVIAADDVPTHSLNYIKIAFSLQSFSKEEMKWLPFFVFLLNHVGTRHHSYAEFDDYVSAFGADIEADYALETPLGSHGSLHGYLTLKLSVLDECFSQGLQCLNERLTQSIFTERGHIQELLRQRRAKVLQDCQDDAHVFARLHAAAGLTPQATLFEHWQGLSHVSDCRQLASLKGHALSEFLDVLSAMMDTLSHATPVAIVHVGSSQNHSALLDMWDLNAMSLSNALVTLPDFHGPSIHRHCGFALSSSVGSCAWMSKAPTIESPQAPALQVLAALLGNGPVWERLRIQGGAYGAFCRFFSLGGLWYVGSARDPNPLQSIETVTDILNHAPSWTSSAIEDAIVTQLKEAPPRPSARCDFLLFAELTHMTEAFRASYREALLNVNAADIATASEQLADMVHRASNTCIATTRKNLTASHCRLIRF